MREDPGGGTDLRLYWILFDLLGLGEAVKYSGVVSNGSNFQSFERLLPQVERGSF